MTTQSHYLQRRLAASVCGVMGVGAAVLSSTAQVVLTDGNAQANINPNSQAGMYNWFVDGQDQLTQQWLWYRVGNVAEQSIDTLSLSAVNNLGANQAQLIYSGTGFDLELTYSLLGGSAGSGVSDVAQQIKILNTSGTTLDFHLFLYADFDLSGSAGGDTVTSVSYTPFPLSAPGYSSVIQVDDLDTQQTVLGTKASRDAHE